MIRASAILSLIVVSVFCFGEPSEQIDFGEALERARLQERLLTPDEQKRLFKVHTHTLNYYDKSCAENIKTPHDGFTTVFEIDSEGKVIYSWLYPVSEHAKCFAGITFRKRFPKPNKIPFYTFVEWYNP